MAKGFRVLCCSEICQRDSNATECTRTHSAVAGVMLTAATALANSPHFMWWRGDSAINLAVG